MRTVSALEVRRRFGAILDEAAAGEQIVIERAGQPIAALVPLTDLRDVTPEARKRHRLEAIAEIKRLAREYPIDIPDPAALVRQMREERDAQIMANVLRDRERHR
ncbi:MAG: type II toxin-antitoxin system prevent-host-death family antitoxin [Chloroflexota bacterium]